MKTPLIKDAEVGDRIRFGEVGNIREGLILDRLMFGNQRTGLLVQVDGKSIEMSYDQLIDKYAHVID